VPWNDPDCLALCDTSGGPFGDRSVARVFAATWQILTAVAGTGLAVWATVHYTRSSRIARRGALRTLLPAVIAGLAWAYWAIALLFPSSAVPPTGEILVTAFAWRAIAATLLAIGLTWLLLDERRTLSAVQRITEQLSPLPGGGSLRTALAGALGDPNLQLVFPLPGQGGLVDAAGVAVADDAARVGTRRTTIEYRGETVAVAIAVGSALTSRWPTTWARPSDWRPRTSDCSRPFDTRCWSCERRGGGSWRRATPRDMRSNATFTMERSTGCWGSSTN
jgi:hypothetical protein